MGPNTDAGFSFETPFGVPSSISKKTICLHYASLFGFLMFNYLLAILFSHVQYYEPVTTCILKFRRPVMCADFGFKDCAVLTSIFIYSDL